MERELFIRDADPEEAKRKKLEECFASDEYRQIMHERIDSVDARALIVEE